MQKIKIDPYLSLCTKIKSKWIKDLNIKPDALNVIEQTVLHLQSGVSTIQPLFSMTSLNSQADGWNQKISFEVRLTQSQENTNGMFSLISEYQENSQEYPYTTYKPYEVQEGKPKCLCCSTTQKAEQQQQ